MSEVSSLGSDTLVSTTRIPAAKPLPAPLREMSRRWLESLDPAQFDGCHEYLLAVRLARHMSKTDIVSASMIDGDPRSGVSLPTVSKIESGNYGEPGFRTMVRLARAYGIPLSSLERFFP